MSFEKCKIARWSTRNIVLSQIFFPFISVLFEFAEIRIGLNENLALDKQSAGMVFKLRLMSGFLL